MDFNQFLAVLRRRWRTVVGILALALMASAGFTYSQTPIYESRSQVFLTVDVRDTTDAYAASLFASGRATAYANLASSTELAERVIEALDLEMTPEDLASNTTGKVIESTSLIELRVTAEDPDLATQINEVTTSEFTDYIEQLETPSSGPSGPQIVAQVTAQASLNRSQTSPVVILNLLTSLLIGLFAGIALAVARDLLDRTVRSAAHVTELTDAPVLATIGYDSHVKQAPLLTDIGGFAARTEAFRLLRTNLQFVDLDNPPRCLMITSAVPGEGKTMTATNLAVALAQTGRNTLIIDADLRRPRVAATLNLDPAIGLTTALVGRTEIHEAIQIHEASGLHVLASGAKPPNPTEILQSNITHDLIRRLRASYDMVIIDAPPLLPVADASVLSTLADGVLLVVRHGKTTRDQVSEAIGRLQQVGARLYGMLVNMVGKNDIGTYYYYYYEESSPVSGRSSDPGAKSEPRQKPPKGGKRAGP